MQWYLATLNQPECHEVDFFLTGSNIFQTFEFEVDMDLRREEEEVEAVISQKLQ